MALPVKPYLQHVSLHPEAGFDLDAYPYTIPAVRELDRIDFHPDVTFFVGENGAGKSTVLEAIALALGHIATHSPILLSYPNARILLFDGTGITEVAYEDTEHYAVTRDFLNHYPRRLEQLLADD